MQDQNSQLVECSRIQTKNCQLQQKDFQLQRLNSKIQQQDFKMKEQNLKLKEQEFQMKEQEFELKEQEFKMKEYNFKMKYYDAKVEQQDSKMKGQDSKTKEQNIEKRISRQIPSILNVIAHIEFTLLKELYLTRCQIQSAEPVQYLNCPNIKQINLAENHLAVLRAFGHTNFKNLSCLTLKLNYFNHDSLQNIVRMSFNKRQNHRTLIYDKTKIFPKPQIKKILGNFNHQQNHQENQQENDESMQRQFIQAPSEQLIKSMIGISVQNKDFWVYIKEAKLRKVIHRKKNL